MYKITRKLRAATIVCALLAALPVSAQQARLSPLRGTIENVDGSVVMIKSRDGKDLKLIASDDVVVRGVVKIRLSDVKPGSFIGVAGIPQQDGSQSALSVILFPELPQAVRNELEGFTPYDL